MLYQVLFSHVVLGTFLSIKEKLTQVLASAKEMYSSLNHCLSLVSQQEEVGNLCFMTSSFKGVNDIEL